MGSDTAAASPRIPQRKTYTISKAREKWTDEEHTAFVEALHKRGRNWKAIVQDIGTRTVAQVRSHAQKYFLKLEKDGHQDEIPPPRPKKRASRPYPVQARLAHQPEPAVKAMQSQKGQSAAAAASQAAAAQASEDTDIEQQQQASAWASDSGSALAATTQADADANFSKLYAIVGSMFDSAVSVPEQLSTIEHLPAEQREPLLLMLGHLTANLRETVRNQRPNAAATLPQLQPLQSALLQPKPEQPLLQPKLSAQSPPACQAQKPRSHRPRPRN